MYPYGKLCSTVVDADVTMQKRTISPNFSKGAKAGPPAKKYRGMNESEKNLESYKVN